MTGHPELNYPAFNEAADQLRRAGYQVLNPAEHEKPCENPEWEDWMKEALGAVLRADAIATLPRWTGSRGAIVELAVAGALGKPHGPIGYWIKRAQQIGAN